MEKMSLSVVVPAYNEAEGIRRVVEQLREVLARAAVEHEIIVVNDGSTDDTAAIAREAGAEVVSHPVNAGYGQSLLTGFSRSRHEYVAMIDADGSYPAAELTKLLAYAPAFDMVIGARHGANYWGTMFKYPMRIVFLWLSEYVTGQKIPDANSGLRIIKKSSIPSSPLFCRGFSFSTTLTLMFLSSGLFVKFVPIDYMPRLGSSKIRVVRDTLRTGQVIVESVIFYNPLKFALPISLIPALGALALLLMFFLTPGWHTPTVLGWTLVSLYGALLIFFFGALLDLIRLTRKS